MNTQFAIHGGVVYVLEGQPTRVAHDPVRQ